MHVVDTMRVSTIQINTEMNYMKKLAEDKARYSEHACCIDMGNVDIPSKNTHYS